MTEQQEDSEKRFHGIMDKLFNSPKPKSLTTSSPGYQSLRGKQRGLMHDSSDSGKTIVSLGGRLNHSSASAAAEAAPVCRPWDRGDLIRRLATFKSMTWFGKPKVVSAVNCARRGWINIEMDIIACEACGSRLLFSTPSSWTHQQIEKAAAGFSLKLDSGHKLFCPWSNNACDESLMQFPPKSDADLVDGYRERSSAFMQFSALPVVSSMVVDHMRTPQLECFLEHSSTLEVGLGSLDFTRIESVGRETASGTLYYQALKLISLCGWEPRPLPYLVDCNDWSKQTTEKCYSKESSLQVVNGQIPGVTIHPLSGANEEIYECQPSLNGKHSDPASVVLDCRLCGASVGLWAFSTTVRPLELFRTLESLERNHQNDYPSCDSGIVSCIAGSPRTDASGKEDNNSQCERNMGSSTALLKEIPSDLKLSIAGGPSPAKQNYRATISLPIITRYLRAGMSGISSKRQHPTAECDSSTDMHEKNHTIPGEDVRPLKRYRNEDGCCISGEDDRSHPNHESKEDDLPTIKKGDTASSVDAYSTLRVENGIESPRAMQHENGESLEHTEMGGGSSSQDKECYAIVPVSNGTIGNGETSTENTLMVSTAEVCSHHSNVILSESSTKRQEISSAARQESSFNASYPNATADISCKIYPLMDDTTTMYQKSLCIQGDGEKSEAGKNTRQHSVNNVAVSANGLGKDGKLEQGMEFDPIRQHRHFCPWIVSSGRTAAGWQLTLTALDHQRESCRPDNLPLSILEVDDPLISVRRLFTPPSTKRS